MLFVLVWIRKVLIYSLHEHLEVHDCPLDERLIYLIYFCRYTYILSNCSTWNISEKPVSLGASNV